VELEKDTKAGESSNRIVNDKYTMNINDLENFRLSDAVKFHNTLNPDLFTDERMQEDVRKQLLAIAEDFVEFMGIDTIKVVDIRLYGSSAAYTYTKHSDIDLHVLVDMSDIEDDEVYSELFNSKKRLYNDNLDITVRGLPVELYMQDAGEEVKSLGDYSVLNGRWVKFPKRAKASLEEHSVKEKFKRLIVLSELALRSSDIDLLDSLLDTLRRYRQSGLEEGGEFSPENIAYKALRSKGIVDKLYKHRDVLHSDELSIDEDVYENTVPRKITYHITPRRNVMSIMAKGLRPGIGDRSSKIDGETHGIYTFPNKQSAEDALMNWLGDEFDEDEELSLLKVDITGLRTVQGADYEIIVTEPITPDRITTDTLLLESSGYIPSYSEKDDPRFKTALSVDVDPNIMPRQAKVMGLGTINRDGRPQQLQPSGKFTR